MAARARPSTTNCWRRSAWVPATRRRRTTAGWARRAVRGRAGPAIDALLSGESAPGAVRADALDPQNPLDALCARAAEALQRLHAAPGAAEAMAEIDAISEALEPAFQLLAPLLGAYQASER